MEEKEKGFKIDWEKILSSHEHNDMLDDHGSVILGSREKKPQFEQENLW